MRKILTLIIFAAFLSGCSGFNDDNINLKIETYYTGDQKFKLDELIVKFNNTIGYDNKVVVSYSSMGTVNDLSEKLYTSAFGKEGVKPLPDLFVTYPAVAMKLKGYVRLFDFRELYSDGELKDFEDKFLQFSTDKNESVLYMLPISKSTEVILIDRLEFEKIGKKVGVSGKDLSTFEGIAEVAEKFYKHTDALSPDVKNNGKAFFAIGSAANYFMNGLHQFGVVPIEKVEGNLRLNLPEDVMRVLWKNYYVPMVKGYYLRKNKYPSDDLAGDVITGCLTNSTSVSYFSKSAKFNQSDSGKVKGVNNIELRILEAPYFRDCKVKSVYLQGGGIFALHTDDPKKKRAIKLFSSFLLNNINNAELNMSSLYMPVKKIVFCEEFLNDYKRTHDFDNNSLSVLSVSFKQIKDREVYSGEEQNQQEELRFIAENYFHTKSVEAAAEFKKRIASGEDYETVLNSLTSEEVFQNWYKEFKKSCEYVLNEIK